MSITPPSLAEIVHDVAPGAQILFHSAFNNTNTSPGQSIGVAINALVAAGADIIVDDVAYLTMPAYQDGLSAIAAKAAFSTNGFILCSPCRTLNAAALCRLASAHPDSLASTHAFSHLLGQMRWVDLRGRSLMAASPTRIL